MLGNAVWRAGRVVDVVQHGGADHGWWHADVGDDGGDGQAVGEARVAAAAGLARVPDGGFVVGVLDERDIGVRVMRTHDGQDAVQGGGGGAALTRSRC
ncbi:hypothetical protein [Streptomyces mirabilis]|uniref:hypothetical protein n=1 Tax=Streptomyces mirabilis TaxID=68239 RepID=UPI0032488018